MHVKDDHILVSIQEAPLDVQAVDRFLRDERAGAVCLFTGTTRRWTRGMETMSLDYDAYETMAERVMRDLAHQAFSRWDLARIALVHRTGHVPLTEASVITGVSSPHRSEAFSACKWLIDTLKTEVPIWKKELYADGRSEWVGPQGADPSSQPNHT